MENINTFKELIKVCEKNNKTIYEAVLDYEAQIGENSEYKTRVQAKRTLDAMKAAIKRGIKSSELSPSGLSGDDCKKLQKYFSHNNSLLSKMAQKTMVYALATSEENLRMGIIAACPTAGSCGIVPSILTSYSELYEIPEEIEINALLTAGVIGKIISNKLSPSGAMGGCQAECGTASAMAAAALTQMRGGDIYQIINSSALAIKNILGLTCDPVCGLVEIPCVKRNPFLALHALTASELALSGIISKIPADEVIDALALTAQLMSPLLKESSQGGLAKTKTALELEKTILKK